MHAGHVISGAGHAGLIGWMLLGGLLQPAELPFEVTEVSVISSEAFDTLLAAQVAPTPVSDVAQPTPPAPETPTTTPPKPESEVAVAPPPEDVVAPDPEDAPVAPAPVPPATVDDTAPILPSPPSDVAVVAPEITDRAVPRPSDRVAPEAVTAPDPEAVPDPVEKEAVREDDSGETEKEIADAAAPEEAATEIVTEAEKPSAAPVSSMRPPARRPSPPAKVAETPEPEPAPAPAPSTDDAVNAALAEALGAPDPEPAAPKGPPLSAGEKDALRVAVSSCWNVGSLSSEALQTTVVVTVSMQQDGKPLNGSIRMTGSSGGSSSAAKQAFEAARRAIIRCGARGFNLPVEKYGQWKDIEMTFNPERMRIK